MIDHPKFRLRIDGPPVKAAGIAKSPSDCPANGKRIRSSFSTRLGLNGRVVGVLRLRGSLRMSGPERTRSLALIGRAIMELRNRALHRAQFLRHTPDAPAMLTKTLAGL